MEKAKFSDALTELHGISSAIGELGTMLNGRDEYGLGYLLHGLRGSLNDQIDALEALERQEGRP